MLQASSGRSASLKALFHSCCGRTGSAVPFSRLSSTCNPQAHLFGHGQEQELQVLRLGVRTARRAVCRLHLQEQARAQACMCYCWANTWLPSRKQLWHSQLLQLQQLGRPQLSVRRTQAAPPLHGWRPAGHSCRTHSVAS